MLGRFNPEAQKVMVEAKRIALQHGISQITPECLLVALCAVDCTARSILRDLGIDEVSTRPLVGQQLDFANIHVELSRQMPFHPDAREVLNLSYETAVARRARAVDSTHILLGLLGLERGSVCEFLRERGVTKERVGAGSNSGPNPEPNSDRMKSADGVDQLILNLDDNLLRKLNALIDVGAFQSLGEAAAFFISRGIEAESEKMQEVEHRMAEMEEIRNSIRETFLTEQRGAGAR